jgi:hypothetical protein
MSTITQSQKRGSIRYVSIVISSKYQTRRLHVVIGRQALKPQRGVADVLQPLHKATTSHFNWGKNSESVHSPSMTHTFKSATCVPDLAPMMLLAKLP